MTADASIDPLDAGSWPSHCPKCRAALTKKRQCMGHSSRTGQHCMKTAVRGARVCGTHGGSLKRTKQAAEGRKAEVVAHRAIVTYGLPREIEAKDALLEELHRTAGHVAWLQTLVGDMEDPKHLTQYTEAGRRASVWVELYHHERKHLTDVAKTCLAAGIEERRVRLAEDQGRMLAEVVRTIVTGLGHDLQDEEVRRVVQPALQLVRSAA